MVLNSEPAFLAHEVNEYYTMRIGVDIQPLQSAGSKNRGIGRYTLALLEALLKRQSPYEYEFLANSQLQEPALKLNDLSNRWINYPETYDCHANKLLAEVTLLCADYDAAFFPSPLEGLDTALPNFAGLPLKIFSVCYDLIPLIFHEQYLYDKNGRDEYLKRLNSLCHADLIFAISEATRQDTINYLGVDPARVINISSGVSPFFCPLTSAERVHWGDHIAAKFGIDKPFIMYTGGEDWRKNLKGLVTAFARLPGRLRQTHRLVIACRLSNQGLQELQDLAKLLGINDSVTLTNFVTDDELRALYSLCTLFVFPSLYEGFGLPVLEAMACGSPAIAGNNSSLPEILGDEYLLFDSRSPDAIAGSMEKILDDEEMRSRVATAAVQRSRLFSWDSVAQRVEEGLAWSQAHQSVINHTSVNFRRSKCHRNKPLFAFFSPFRPVKSGISDYSANLLPSLQEYYDFDLYYDSLYHSQNDLELGDLQRHAVPSHQFEKSVKLKNYRSILYQFGNSEYHIFMYTRLLRFAGISVLHDYHLGELMNELFKREKHLGDFFSSELSHNYGRGRADEILKLLRNGKLDVASLSSHKIYMNRRIFTRSLGVIVHNQWAYDQATSDFHRDCEYITKIPLVTPRVKRDSSAPSLVRDQLGIPQGSFIIGTFGFVAYTKRPLPILEAFQKYLLKHPDAHLVFVGKTDALDSHRPVTMTEAVSELGLQGHVHVTGFVTSQEFGQYIQAADICLNLRYPYHGETSAALLQLLSYGKPTVVTDIGSFSEVPDDMVLKIPPPTDGDEVQEIYRALVALTDHPELREALGRNAAEYTVREHSPERCAALYAQFIEQVLRSPSTRKKMLADYVGREAAAIRTDNPAKLFQVFAETIEGHGRSGASRPGAAHKTS